MTKICILTPAPEYELNWQKERACFDALFGAGVHYRSWTDHGDLSEFSLILPLLTWGYHQSPALWQQALSRWEGDGLPFANPVSVLRWNTDKVYLFDLEAEGVAIVPTRITSALQTEDLDAARIAFGVQDIIVKPLTSAGADDTHLLRGAGTAPADVMNRHMLIQPMMDAIAREGEYSLFMFNGRLSHAILKCPASGDFRVQEQFGGQERTVEAPDGALILATDALATLPVTPLYARVDMVRDGAGQFCLMELEMIEPALFLAHAGGGGALFASAVRELVD